ncbi:MAG: glycine betaine/L-proline ABC transporter permease ProW [Burkholderiaceae bacterium]|jgi:glycine betaine/proline transport system permease protein|nr:glycine betaine/L-proline ABC transporter permease ProW [Burkholderiaceae bacterium]
MDPTTPLNSPTGTPAAPPELFVPESGADAATAATAAPQDDPWASASDLAGAGADAAASHWLGSAAPPTSADTSAGEGGLALLAQLWDGNLPVHDWINSALAWSVAHCRPFFMSVRDPIAATLTGVETALLAAPAPLMALLLGLLAWQCAGRGAALGTLAALLLLAVLNIWAEAMTTLSLVLTALVFCVLIGLPLGIALAASSRAQRIARPLLDAMQTTPAFVYLVPVVMLFGIGNVPGVIVTIVFALPPLVRLTALGIRQVPPDLVEAARAYGASPWQLLLKVQLPLAMPSIMAGINQALMLSLSMVVIASMIAVGGLGQMVLRGIGRLDMGLATVGGLGIVLLAIALDRLTQAMGQRQRDSRPWWQSGPIGLAWRGLRPRARSQAPATRAGAAATPARISHSH